MSAKSVIFDDYTMWITLSDGRILGVPLAWFPKLINASQPQREQFKLTINGIHWDALDENISVAELLAEKVDMTHRLHSSRSFPASP